MHEGTAADREELAARAQAKAAQGRALAAEAKAKAAEASARIARMERGEDVPGGLGEPLDAERMLRQAGFTTRDITEARLMTEVCDALGDDVVIEQTVKESVEASERAGRAVVRRLARRLRRGDL